jgi:cytochrome c556
MTFRGQVGRKGISKQFSKSTHEKKAKQKKKHNAVRYAEETPIASSEEITDKTLKALNSLGNQIFALSPFSQYFDDWLVNLEQVVLQFETNAAIEVDEQFQKERIQIFKDLQEALAKEKLEESNLTTEAKALSDNNHMMVEADREYARNTRDLCNRRNSEIQRLSAKIRTIEDEIALQQQTKFGFFSFNEKKRAAVKLAQTNQNLTIAKNELETATQNFTAEQDKLHDNYTKLKQDLNKKSDDLHGEIERLETDTSLAIRQAACNSLAQTVNNLLSRS